MPYLFTLMLVGLLLWVDVAQDHRTTELEQTVLILEGTVDLAIKGITILMKEQRFAPEHQSDSTEPGPADPTPAPTEANTTTVMAYPQGRPVASGPEGRVAAGLRVPSWYPVASSRADEHGCEASAPARLWGAGVVRAGLEAVLCTGPEA